GRVEEWLTVLRARLLALGFFAVAAGSLQDQRPIGVKMQRVAEIRSRRLEVERSNGGVAGLVGSAHIPGIDPGRKRLCVNTGLPDAAAGKGFGKTVGARAGDGGVAHPKLPIGPSFLVIAWAHRLAEQSPLRTIG